MIFSYYDKCHANRILRRMNSYITRLQFVRVEGLFFLMLRCYLLNAFLMARRRLLY